MPAKRSSQFFSGLLLALSFNALAVETQYQAIVQVEEQQYHGLATVERDIQEHYSILRFKTSFDPALPEQVDLPELEEVEKSGGLTLSRTEPPLKEEGSEALVRISEYKAFDDLERKLIQLTDQPLGQELPGDSQEYRSGFLLLSQPAAIAHTVIDQNASGYTVKLTMTDGSRLQFELDNQKVITDIAVNRGNLRVRYSVDRSDS